MIKYTYPHNLWLYLNIFYTKIIKHIQFLIDLNSFKIIRTKYMYCFETGVTTFHLQPISTFSYASFLSICCQ